MHKDIRKIVKAAEKAGFECRELKSGHVQVFLDGVIVSTFPGTPSDHKSILNCLAPMKRAGFVWPPRR